MDERPVSRPFTFDRIVVCYGECVIALSALTMPLPYHEL